MVDEIFDRQYREARGQLNASLAHGLGALATAVRQAFEVLVRIEYQSPWTARPRRVRGH